MDSSWIEFFCSYAHHAYWIFFLFLTVPGLNFVFNEDLLLLTAGALASSCIPESRFFLYGWLFAGSALSAWESYWIGYLLGPKLYRFRIFRYFVRPKTVRKLHHYYELFGVWAFMVIRFIPGGARNALFVTSGLGKMPFYRFIFRDGLACLIYTSTVYSLGYFFAENYTLIANAFKNYSRIIALILIVGVLGIFFWRWYYKKKSP